MGSNIEESSIIMQPTIQLKYLSSVVMKKNKISAKYTDHSLSVCQWNWQDRKGLDCSLWECIQPGWGLREMIAGLEQSISKIGRMLLL